MDLEEQQGLIKQARPKKPVRKVQYTKAIFLFLVIVMLAIVIGVDIAGYLELKEYILPKLAKIPDQLPAPMQATTEPEQIANKEEENQGIDGPGMQFESGAFEIIGEGSEGNDEIVPLEELKEEAEIMEADQQLQQLTLIQQPNKIDISAIDDNQYDYFVMPNNMKVLLIQNKKFKDEQILLNVNKGYWDTQYQLKCDYEVLANERETIYSLKTDKNSLFKSLQQFGQLFNQEQPKLKDLKVSKLKPYMQLLSIFANKDHPLSKDYKRKPEQFQYSANQMTLIVKTATDLKKLKNFLIESDLVLVKDHSHKSNRQPIFTDMGLAIKWSDSQDTNSIKLLFQLNLEDKSTSIGLLDYCIRTSFKSYVQEQNFGLDVKTRTIFEDETAQLYEVQIDLPYNDDLEFDKRELAYKLSKSLGSLLNQIDKDMETELFTQMEKQYQQLNFIKFNYESTWLDLNTVSNNINHGYVKEAFSRGYLEDYNHEKMRETIRQIQNPKNMIIIVNDQQYHYAAFIQLNKGSATQDLLFLSDDELKTKYNGLAYSVKRLTDQTLSFIQQCDEQIAFELPKQNPFIPSSFAMIEKSTELKQLRENAFWQADISFRIPSVFAGIAFHAADKWALAQYYYDQLSNSFGQALQAGYKIDVTQDQYLKVYLYGWSEQFESFYTRAIAILTEKADQAKLERVYDQFEILPAHVKLVKFEIDKILIGTDLTKESIGKSKKQVLFYGNINEESAKNLIKVTEKQLSLNEEKGLSYKVVKIGQRRLKYRVETEEKWQVLVQYYQFGKREAETAALYDLTYKYLADKQQKSKDHYLIERKQVGCVDGFVIIKQSFKSLSEEDEKVSEEVRQSLEQMGRIGQKELNRLKKTLYAKKVGLLQKGSDVFDRIVFNYDEQVLRMSLKGVTQKDVKRLTKEMGALSFYIEGSEPKSAGLMESMTELAGLNLEKMECN